jgi:type IV pilus assembly protein PilN
MIRINLLPVRAAKKKETAIQQFVLAGAVVVIIALVVGALYGLKYIQVNTTKNEITAANEKIKELETKIGKLNALKDLKEQVKKKLDVLAQLRKNKTGPAQRLASLSDLTPDQLWITSYSESSQDVKLSGIAFTEELIAQFMKSLESSTDFMGVELLVSEQIVSGDTKLKKFDISMKLETVTVPPPPGPAAPAAVKK